jgi:polar amino acid transport system permease protein
LVIVEYAPVVLRGAANTTAIFAGAFLTAIAMGLFSGAVLARGKGIAKVIARTYVELFRGTSAVVQLFWIFFVLPILGVSISALTAAIIGLGLCFGAYFAEVVRSAILSVPKAQREAARALSLSRLQTFALVILPQMAVIAIPLVENIAILLLKATAGASLITVPELTFTAYTLNARTFRTVEIFVVILLLYYAFAWSITGLAAALRRRYGGWVVAAP